MNTNFIEHKYKFKKFTKEQRSSFIYWYYHWKAFNLTAYHLGHWRFKYLFHDIEKPFLMLLWRNYKRVQEFHRTKNRHHIEYPKYYKWDLEAMIIDWECSGLTKTASPLNAVDTLKAMVVKGNSDLYVEDNIITTSLIRRMPEVFLKLGLIDYEEKIKLQSDLIYNRQQVEQYNKVLYNEIKNK